MRYLIDTHIFIWIMEDSKKISAKVKLQLKDSANEVFISVATIWEVAVKKSKGSLKTPKNIQKGVNEVGFKILPIELPHALEVENLPFYRDHKDPFDRILISQAKAENLTLITSDPKIWKYKIKILKA